MINNNDNNKNEKLKKIFEKIKFKRVVFSYLIFIILNFLIQFFTNKPINKDIIIGVSIGHIALILLPYLYYKVNDEI